MAKKKKSKTQIEYERVRSNLLQNIRRLEKRGYDVGIDVPKRPDKITKKDIRELKDLNRRRYKFATYETSEIVGEPGSERIETVRISGYEARKRERKIAAGKGKTTKLINKAKRSTQELQDYRKDHTPYTDEYAGTDWEYEKYREERRRSADILREEGEKVSQQPADYYNPETGEVIPASEHMMLPRSERDQFVKILPRNEMTDLRYNHVMQMLETMAQYDGYVRYDNKGHKHRSSKKHDETTRSNAEAIKSFIEQKYEENPEETAEILEEMDEQGSFDAPDFFYFVGGYQKFLYEFEMMFNYKRDLDRYDQNNDSNDYSDFEEDY